MASNQNVRMSYMEASPEARARVSKISVVIKRKSSPVRQSSVTSEMRGVLDILSEEVKEVTISSPL